MENKRKIVNGGIGGKCVFSDEELDIIYNALDRLYCQLDEKRANACEISAADFYNEQCEEVLALLDKVDNFMED